MSAPIIVKHRRQQWPVGHGFFHTAKIDVEGTIYRYVYDCGSHRKKTLANKRVDEYWSVETLEGNTRPNIDMLVVSHFHTDHINGIQQLFQRFRIKKLVLPFISLDSQIIALAQFASSGPTAWKIFHEIVTDPRNWVLRNNGDGTEIIHVVDERGESDNDRTIFSVGDERPNAQPNKIDQPPTTLSHDTPQLIYQSGQALWNFLFYVQNNQNTASTIIANLNSKFGLAKHDLLIKLQDQSWIRANWKVIRGCYMSLGTSNQNATSLCMFSGPTHDYLLHGSRTSIFPCHPYRYWRGNIGWLGTGDAKLNDTNKYLAFRNHFNKFIKQVSTISIPHHGSIHNYHSGLGEIGNLHVMTSDYKTDPKGHHPSPIVVAHIQTECGNPVVVTKDDKTRLFEQFDLEHS